MSKLSPLLSIIIPTFNTQKFYKACLESLLKINYLNFEIVVVDDGSTDGSYEAMVQMANKNPKLHIIQTLKRRGIPASRNVGIEASCGELIAFFDMDMKVTNTWPSELIKFLNSDKKIGGVIPKVFDFHKRDIFQSVGGRIIPQTPGPLVRGLGEKDTGQYDKPEKVSINAAGVIIRKEVAKQLAGYDENLGMFDDIDFGWRMWIYGWESWYVPSAYIYHYTAKPWSERAGSSKIMHEYYLDNFIRVALKNFEAENVIKYFPQAIFITIVRIFLNLLKGNIVPLVGATEALLVNLVRLPTTLSERKIVQANRKVSDKSLMGSTFVEGSYLEIYLRNIRRDLHISRFWKEIYSDKKAKVKEPTLLGNLRMELSILATKAFSLFDKRTITTKQKSDIINSYQKRYRVKSLVETGTYVGDMVALNLDHFENIVSVEISPMLSKRAKKRFSGNKKVKIINGDSGEVIENILKKSKEPLLFWLDAHCSGGITGMTSEWTPIKKELELIFRDKIKKHVILIDDAELLVGKYDYPSRKEILSMIEKYAPNYTLSSSNGVARITP